MAGIASMPSNHSIYYRQALQEFIAGRKALQAGIAGMARVAGMVGFAGRHYRHVTYCKKTLKVGTQAEFECRQSGKHCRLAGRHCSQEVMQASFAGRQASRHCMESVRQSGIVFRHCSQTLQAVIQACISGMLIRHGSQALQACLACIAGRFCWHGS